MALTAPEEVRDALWSSKHWWSSKIDLTSGGNTITSMRTGGSRGSVEVKNRQYRIERFRLPPFITIRDAETDTLIARLSLTPKRGGFLAEFADGESFRLGWANWWKREWNWTSDAGQLVISSRRAWFRNGIELQIEPGADPETWPLLAALELAIAKLGIPWF